MKILKRGQLPQDKIYTVSCNNCKSEMEFQAHEGKSECDPRDSVTLITINCPFCNHKLYVNS